MKSPRSPQPPVGPGPEWGREVKLVIAKSPIHGNGVFASGPIRAGTPVASLTGEPRHYSSFPRDLLLARGFEVAKDTYVDPDRGSPAWFFNHSGTPNCRYSITTREVTALREISPGEELTLDYCGTTTWEGYGELWKGGTPP